MTPTSTEVQIHEFSTGIRPERTADGGWVSLGFTGQYMNATIDPIPYAVQRSIANKEFAVAEGASSDEPAIIGRVVSGGEESDWSVVAVVTRGQDEKGRSASVYRYFLAEGSDSLCEIVAWIEDQQQNGRMPVFDPFETKVVGQPNISTVSAPDFKPLSDEVESWLFSDSAPIIIQPEQPYTAQIIDKLATEKADTNRQPVAWAFKVEALEQPGRFQIIQAASDRAYEVLQRVKVSMTEFTGPFVDEQAIKSAIKGLISSSRVKPEYVQAINEALGNNQIPEIYWKEIFDGQGASNALKQGIYSPQMVRLLTLRAIVIPQTLPDYLKWLGNGNKQNELDKVSNEFQSQLNKSLSQLPDTVPNLEFKIFEGVILVLPKLLDRKVSVENVLWLLTSKNGLWGKFYQQLLQDIENDLQLMSQFSKSSKDLPFNLTDTPWESIWREIQVYWQRNSYTPKEKYQVFSELFNRLCHYKLSACFYAISFGSVPEKIFIQAFPNDRWQSRIYNLVVYKQLTYSDKLLLLLKKNTQLIIKISGIIAVVLVLILGINKILENQKKQAAITKFFQKNNSYEAIRKTVNGLVIESSNEYETGHQQSHQNIENAIIEILVGKSFDSAKKDFPKDVIEYSYKSKEFGTSKDKIGQVVDVIISYEKSQNKQKLLQNNQVDGIIEINGSTAKLLKCQVANKLSIKSVIQSQECKNITDQ